MKVLIAVDGSEGGWEAVHQVGGLISPEMDQGALYYSPPEVRFPRGAAPTADVIERAKTTLADAVFAEAVQRLPEPARDKVHKIVGHQNPRNGILAAADDWRADLIAVGARGGATLEQLLLGSVSQSVVHHATIPVLVARAGAGKKSGTSQNVLVAWDDSKHSQRTKELLGKLTWTPGTVGRLIHVIEPMFVGQLPPWLEKMARDATTEPMAQAWVKEHEAEKRHKAEQLAALRLDLPTAFRDAAPIVSEGYPSEQILKAVSRERIDLVVVGAKGKGAIERLMLGSTSEKVLSHAPCSVLVVRQHEAG